MCRNGTQQVNSTKQKLVAALPGIKELVEAADNMLGQKKRKFPALPVVPAEPVDPKDEPAKAEPKEEPK